MTPETLATSDLWLDPASVRAVMLRIISRNPAGITAAKLCEELRALGAPEDTTPDTVGATSPAEVLAPVPSFFVGLN